MMMKADALFALELISLVAGMMLLMKACKEDVCCKGCFKIVGYFVVIASFLLMISTGMNYAKTCDRCGYHKKMGGMGGMGMMAPKMHEKLMKECPMLKKMMENDKEGDNDVDEDK